MDNPIFAREITVLIQENEKLLKELDSIKEENRKLVEKNENLMKMLGEYNTAG